MQHPKSRVMLLQITSKWFCAGVVTDPVTQRVLRAAPIIDYMLGWTAQRVQRFARKRGWKIEVLR